MKAVLTILFFCLCVVAHAQPLQFCDGNVPKEQISGMCRNNDKIFMVPHYPDKGDSTIHSINVTDVEQTIARPDDCIERTKWRITNMGFATGLEGYQGLEAVATDVAGNIYFTVETYASTPDCYVLKGRLDENKKEILLQKKQAIKRPVSYLGMDADNKGFESLAYMPDSNKLVAFFEYNAENDEPTAVVLDTSLKILTEVRFRQPQLFRITDVCYNGGGMFTATQFYYPGDAKKFTPGLYREKVAAMFEDGKTPEMSCYATLLKLTYSNGVIESERIGNAPVTYECVNWEGIAPVKEGILRVSDNFPPNGGVTTVEYVPLR